jgi:hypothetical protein
MADVELASTAAAGARASIARKTSRFTSTNSGRFSWTQSTSTSASSMRVTIDTRRTAPAASSTRPASCCRARLVAMRSPAMSSCSGTLS